MNPIVDKVGSCSTCGWPIEHYKGEPADVWHHAGIMRRIEEPKAVQS